MIIIIIFWPWSAWHSWVNNHKLSAVRYSLVGPETLPSQWRHSPTGSATASFHRWHFGFYMQAVMHWPLFNCLWGKVWWVLTVHKPIYAKAIVTISPPPDLPPAVNSSHSLWSLLHVRCYCTPRPRLLHVLSTRDQVYYNNAFSMPSQILPNNISPWYVVTMRVLHQNPQFIGIEGFEIKIWPHRNLSLETTNQLFSDRVTFFGFKAQPQRAKLTESQWL